LYLYYQVISIEFDHFLFIFAIVSSEWFINRLVFHAEIEGDGADKEDDSIDLE